MTITVSIANNLEYCRQNNLIQIRSEPCLCADNPTPGCHYCTMTSDPTPGVWVEEIYPFELNMANANFSTLWNSLGLDFDYCGQIDARIVLRALESMDSDLPLRAAVHDTGVDEDGRRVGPEIIKCAIGRLQVVRYVIELSKICEEAERREELVCWG